MRWSCIPVLAALAMLACGPGRPEDPPGGPSPGADSVRAMVPVAHSTLADTAGMAADLRLIERKLGPLAPGVRDHLVAVEVRYFSFADSTCTAVDRRTLRSGVLVVHACIAGEVREIFEAMLRDTFPVARVVPINRYGLNADSTGWNDAASMADNNTSAFNYRRKPGSWALSEHARGTALDINPRQNPLMRVDPHGITTLPPGSRYTPGAPGTLDRHRIARYLPHTGWSWGGRWPRPQDHQHIERSGGPCDAPDDRAR